MPPMILDIRSYWLEILRTFAMKKSIKLTGLIRFLLARDNRTSAKITDCKHCAPTWSLTCVYSKAPVTDLTQAYMTVDRFRLKCYYIIKYSWRSLEKNRTLKVSPKHSAPRWSLPCVKNSSNWLYSWTSLLANKTVDRLALNCYYIIKYSWGKIIW